MNLYEIKEIHINNTCRYASVFLLVCCTFFFITSDRCMLFIQNLFMLEEIHLQRPIYSNIIYIKNITMLC